MRTHFEFNGSGHMSLESRSSRLMWFNHDRLFYDGLLGSPSPRTMGAIIIYVAVKETIRVSLLDGEWQTCEVAVVPPYVPHRVLSDARQVYVIHIEAETVDAPGLPPMLRRCGAVDSPSFVEKVREWRRACGPRFNLAETSTDFDRHFFGRALAPLPMDRRILKVVNEIKRNPSAPSIADDCANIANLSSSRFLHLFKQDVGVGFRAFRLWKRARNLLHYVNKDLNLADVALATGYPDSTHFSHSIRLVYGLTPRDIFAGSRRLAIYAQASIFAPTMQQDGNFRAAANITLAGATRPSR
jgi:AraC-like DNA-binding protein